MNLDHRHHVPTVDELLEKIRQLEAEKATLEEKLAWSSQQLEREYAGRVNVPSTTTNASGQ